MEFSVKLGDDNRDNKADVNVRLVAMGVVIVDETMNLDSILVERLGGMVFSFAARLIGQVRK